MAIEYNSNVAKTLLSSTSTDIINAWLRENPYGVGSVIEILDGSGAALKNAGALILSDNSLVSQFTGMINRIADVMVKAAEFENPLKSFKKDASKYGGVVEDVFVELVEPNLYTMDVSADDFFNLPLPEIKSKLHFINYQTFYKVPISRAEIALCFDSEAGVTDLVNKIMARIDVAAELDEYLAMRYCLARYIADGNAHFELAGSTGTELVENLKAIANDFGFMATKFNHEGVKRTADKSRLHLLVDSKTDAHNDVTVLAQAYNMDKATWTGRKHLFDHLAPEPWEYDRLEKIFTDPGYVRRFTSDEINLLKSVKSIHISDDFFMAVDKLTMMDDFRNGQNLMTTFFAHFWKVMSVSPYSVCVAYVETLPAITAVTVTGPTEDLEAGGVYHYSATVTADAGADTRVYWEVSGTGYTIDQAGTLTVAAGAASSANVTATSLMDPDQNDTLAVALAE